MKNKIATEFMNMNKLPMFEIEVLNHQTSEIEYIIFDVSIIDNVLIASSGDLLVNVEIDTNFSLDEHLQELYCECIELIYETDYHTLPIE